jgi:o-succinylbenzoate synthase
VRGFGEASPLPGFSSDTLADCHAALSALDVSTLPAALGDEQSVLEELRCASSLLPPRLPAARAALEAALLDLWSRAAGKPAWALLVEAGTRPKPRAVSALLMGDPERVLADAEHARARGLETFKLKIGHAGMLEREVALLRELRQSVGAAARLRLDANQSFTAQQAERCLPRFAEYGVELVEEPCPFTELSLLSSPVPLALDESLSQLDPRRDAHGVFELRAASALILKPALLGGISACHAWSQVAARIGAAVILSHTFDGPLGLALSATLALTLGSEAIAQGLDADGARLEQPSLPFFSGTHIRAWSESGLGVRQAEP